MVQVGNGILQRLILQVFGRQLLKRRGESPVSVLKHDDSSTELLRNNTSCSGGGCITVRILSASRSGPLTSRFLLRRIANDSYLARREENLRKTFISTSNLPSDKRLAELCFACIWGSTYNWASWSLIELGGVVVELAKSPQRWVFMVNQLFESRILNRRRGNSGISGRSSSKEAIAGVWNLVAGHGQSDILKGAERQREQRKFWAR